MRDVSISEGKRTRKMAGVNRLVTESPSGDITWVPEEDYRGINKYIHENGTFYASDDGVWAFSNVTVNVYGGVPYKVPELETIDGIIVPVIDPETGEAIETCQIPEAAGEPEQIENPDEIDPETGEPITEPEKDPSTGEIKQTQSGSVIGKDPETGNKVQVKAVTKTDGDGNRKTELVVKELPQAIAVTRMPNNISYHVGDEIDFTGIECSLYIEHEDTGGSGGAVGASGKPFRDNRYPKSKIPFDELIFPVTTATHDAGTYMTIGNTSAEVYGAGTWLGTFLDDSHMPKRIWNKTNDGLALGYFQDAGERGWRGPVLVGVTKESVETTMTEGRQFPLEIITVLIEDDEGILRKWYVMHQWHYAGYDMSHWLTGLPVYSTQFNSIKEEVAGALINYRVQRFDGDGVPVQWRSPYDGSLLTTHINLEVT